MTLTDYEPLDLSPWCNNGYQVLIQDDLNRLAGKSSDQIWLEKGVARANTTDPSIPPIGRQTLRGLPFLIGSQVTGQNDPCFICLDHQSAPVSLPIGRQARYVIFAHRLIDTDLYEDGVMKESGTPGKLVARYIFHFANGHQEVVPIREQYEIAAPRMFGRPFLAIPDQKDLSIRATKDPGS